MIDPGIGGIEFHFTRKLVGLGASAAGASGPVGEPVSSPPHAAVAAAMSKHPTRVRMARDVVQAKDQP
jgi:hypothetical protein